MTMRKIKATVMTVGEPDRRRERRVLVIVLLDLGPWRFPCCDKSGIVSRAIWSFIVFDGTLSSAGGEASVGRW